MPQTFEDVVELLIPELRKRGIFWEDYAVPGGTYRENLLEQPGQKEPTPDHPAGKMIWRPSPKKVGFAVDDKAGLADLSQQSDAIDPLSMQLC
jgi:hypothetical protein